MSGIRQGVALLALAASGCATIVQGSHQQVSFVTQPSGATVRADQQTCTTPCMLRLKRNHNVDALVEKPGYAPETVRLQYELDPWLLGNVVFLPLAMVGGAVDIVSGAGFQLYPPMVQVPLRPTAAEERAPAPREQPRRDAPGPEAPAAEDGWKAIPEGGERI